MKRVSLLIILILLFFTGCTVTNSNQEYELKYESIGNGKIICEYESDKKYDSQTYIYLLSVPNEEEELIEWIVNGATYGKDNGILIQMDKDYNVTARFTENHSNQGTDYNTDFIYGYFPDNWIDVEINITTTSRTVKFPMVKMENDVWSFDIVSNKVGKSAIKTISFSSLGEKTETYKYDSDYNFFNYSGYNRNNLLCGGFFNSKTENVFKLSIMEMNDLHGYIVQSSDGKAGLSNANYLINKVRDEDELDNVLLVANGDMFQGTAISNLTKGLTVVQSMNEMNFDFMGIGNHEFDWGIEYILNYFDGDEANGEANFPLINSNIKDKKTGELLKSDNVLSSTIIEKNGIKIGVISMIDNLRSSILQSRIENYEFLGTTLCKDQAIKLKDEGADIIVANIHGGDSDKPSNFIMNQELAKLQYNGEWLIDCVINGHTHTEQQAYIERAGQDLPIVQGGSYCYYIGQIDLYFDPKTKNFMTSNIISNSIYEADVNCDKDVQKIIDDGYLDVKDQMEEVYCTASATVSSRSSLYTWSANIIRVSTDTICGISNNAGIRSTGDIKYGDPIGIENVYMINPFDNELIIVEATGKEIYNFLNRSKSSVYYSFAPGYSLDGLKNDTKKYKIAVIDYVYYWDSFPRKSNDINTKIILRDAMIEDLRLRQSFNPTTDTTPKIGCLLDK